ncbi:hypothetical protein LCGC14_0485850 [marine sediment metagenome]|uniref:Uncharacterized protein n=1 Tax=marine sediment metagenome TaxID=412755 RepID=A0A0F9VGU7_9ZZZZ
MKAEGRRAVESNNPAVSAMTPVPAQTSFPGRCGTLEGMLFLLAMDQPGVPSAKEYWQKYLEKYPEAKVEGSDGR